MALLDAPALPPPSAAPAPATGAMEIVLRLLPTIVGVAALTAYALLVDRFLGQLKLPDSQWIRAMSLFTGVESIAFAAAGFIFGREVNRSRAEKAEEKATSEAQRANTSVKEAEQAHKNGRQLTREILRAAAEEREIRSAARELGAEPETSRLAALAGRAETLFPLV